VRPRPGPRLGDLPQDGAEHGVVELAPLAGHHLAALVGDQAAQQQVGEGRRAQQVAELGAPAQPLPAGVVGE
jgi:hypothetical protein